MSKTHSTITYRLPTWAVPALVNNDVSGLSDEESAAIEAIEAQAQADEQAEVTYRDGTFSHGHWAIPEDMDESASFYQ